MDKVTFKTIRKLLGEDKVEEALSILVKFSESNQQRGLNNRLILHQGSIISAAKLYSQGFDSSQEFRSTRVRVSSDLLEIINDIERDYPIGHVINIAEDSLHEDRKAKQHLEELVSELSQEMAFNHFTVSFGESMDDNLEKRANDIFEEEYAKKYCQSGDQRRRNIILIGAGATHQSCPYIPFGVRLKEYFESSQDENDKQIVEESKIKKRKGYIYDGKFDPERYLGLINDNLRNESQYKLRLFLHNIYNRRYMPTHAYEIVAHLFKHSFTPVIINFNFDELLDEAIEEEMGNQKYFKILHDGDIPKFDDLFIDGRLKVPIYIKIHGTASQKSSLKFSENHDLYLSQDMKDFIDQLLGGEIINQRVPEPEKIPVNLISIGFDMERFGFNEQISLSNLPKGSKWFQINWNKKMPDIVIGSNGFRYTLESKHIKLSEWENKNPNIPPLADLLIYIFEGKITKIFKPSFPPKGISRHLIIPNLFYLSFKHGHHNDYSDPGETKKIYRKLIDYFTSTKYFFERTIIETALLIIKNKGIIEPRESAREKVGFFYMMYKERFISQSDIFTRKKTLNIIENMELAYESELFSLNQIYEIFKMTNTYSFSNNLINLSPFNVENDRWIEGDQVAILDKLSSENEKITKDDLNTPEHLPILVFYRLLKNMGNMRVLKNLEQQCIVDKNKFNWYNDIIKHAKSIYLGYTYDIRPVFKDSSLLHLNSIKRKHILHTNLSLSYHFSEYFNKNEKWDICLFISERGKLFSNNLFQGGKDFKKTLSDKLIISISCQEAVAKLLNYDKKIESQIEINEIITAAKYEFNYESTNINYHLLPYWRHHHHMIIFLKTETKPPQENNRSYIKIEKDKFLHPIRSLYYFKQGFSNTINPLVFPVIGKSEHEVHFINEDQEFLLNTFFAHYIKSIVYQKSGHLIPVIRQDLSVEMSYKIEQSDSNCYEKALITYDDFLKCLFKKDMSNFIPINTIW